MEENDEKIGEKKVEVKKKKMKMKNVFNLVVDLLLNDRPRSPPFSAGRNVIDLMFLLTDLVEIKKRKKKNLKSPCSDVMNILESQSPTKFFRSLCLLLHLFLLPLHLLLLVLLLLVLGWLTGVTLGKKSG